MSEGIQFDLTNIVHVAEVAGGYLEASDAANAIRQNKGLSFIDHDEHSLLLGRSQMASALIKVCVNLGISRSIELNDELEKLHTLNGLAYRPDIVFDHTRKGVTVKPFWKHMVENYEGVVAIAPVIACFDEGSGLEPASFLEGIEEMAAGGVRLMLFHPTLTPDLWAKAVSQRKSPTTSWSGGLIRRDMKINGRRESIVNLVFDDILKILRKYNVTCDIGTVFRPARVSEALDEAHRGEIQLQEEYVRRAKAAGVLAIREGVGHIPIDKIVEFTSLLDQTTPIMPLPVSTDASIGFDHVACAVAATLIGYHTNLGIISPVTRVEHTGGIPTIGDIVGALKTARVVAHSLDMRNVPQVSDIDNAISDARQSARTCVVSGGMFGFEDEGADRSGCSRCDIHCPIFLRR